MINENEMARMVRKAIDGYFRDLDGEKASGVYDMVIHCVEKPLLESVLHRVQDLPGLGLAIEGYYQWK